MLVLSAAEAANCTSCVVFFERSLIDDTTWNKGPFHSCVLGDLCPRTLLGEAIKIMAPALVDSAFVTGPVESDSPSRTISSWAMSSGMGT